MLSSRLDRKEYKSWRRTSCQHLGTYFVPKPFTDNKYAYVMIRGTAVVLASVARSFSGLLERQSL